MLYFDIRTLETEAVEVSDTLRSDDPVWEASDALPEDGVRVEGRLSAAGDDRFYLTGRITGTVTLACRRCLADVTQTVEEELAQLFAPAGDAVTEDDPDVITYDGGGRDLDIRPAVREQWLLGVPRFAQCSEDCRGLCPQCGTDLNTGTCSCVSDIDSRWEGLRRAASNPSEA